MSKSKGLSHSPSLRAIRNYNDLPIDRKSDGVDNPGFEDEYKYEYYTNPSYGYLIIFNGFSIYDAVFFRDLPVGYDSKLEYDYLTVSTKSMKTSFSGDSENHSHTDNEMGSSVKLVTEKVERVSDDLCFLKKIKIPEIFKLSLPFHIVAILYMKVGNHEEFFLCITCNI